MEINDNDDDSRPAKRCKRVEVSHLSPVHLMSTRLSYSVSRHVHLLLPLYLTTILPHPLPPRRILSLPRSIYQSPLTNIDPLPSPIPS